MKIGRYAIGPPQGINPARLPTGGIQIVRLSGQTERATALAMHHSHLHWVRLPFPHCRLASPKTRYSDFPLLMWPPNCGAVLSCDTSLGANGALLG